jgi:hypothetical protein
MIIFDTSLLTLTLILAEISNVADLFEDSIEEIITPKSLRLEGEEIPRWLHGSTLLRNGPG